MQATLLLLTLFSTLAGTFALTPQSLTNRTETFVNQLLTSNKNQPQTSATKKIALTKKNIANSLLNLLSTSKKITRDCKSVDKFGQKMCTSSINLPLLSLYQRNLRDPFPSTKPTNQYQNHTFFSKKKTGDLTI